MPNNPAPLMDNASIVEAGGKPVNWMSLFSEGMPGQAADNANRKSCSGY